MAQAFDADSSARAYDAQIVLEAVLSNLEDLRIAEIQTGPQSLCCKNLPGQDASGEEISTWLNKLFLQARALAFNNNRLRSNIFSRKSEKIVKAAKNTEKNARKLANKKTISRADAEKSLKDIDEKISLLEAKINANIDAEKSNLEETNRLADALKRLREIRSNIKKQLDTLDEDASDTFDASHYGQETCVDPTQTATSSQEASHDKQENCADPKQTATQSQKVSDSTSAAEGSKKSDRDTSSVVEDIKKNAEQHKSEEDDPLREPQPKGLDDIIRNISPKIDNWTEKTNDDSCYELNSLKKKFNMITTTLSRVKKVVCDTAVLKDKQDRRIPIHPASCHEVYGTSKDGEKFTVDMNNPLEPDTNEEHQKMKEELADKRFSFSLMAIMAVICGVLVLSPTTFLGMPSTLYGMRPCFVRSRFSEYLAVKLTVDFMVMQLAKSRLSDYMQLQYEDLDLSKQQIIEIINGMGRSLSPLAQEMRRILVAETETMHIDDSYMNCLEWQRDDEGNRIRRNCHIWGMTTYARAEKKGAVYLASKSRSTEDFLMQFGLTKQGDKEVILPCGIKNIVSDGCSSHPAGIDKIEKLSNRTILRAGCYAHLRRYFRNALIDLKLLEVFEAASKGDIESFEERVDAELAERGIDVGPYGRKVLTACHMIEIIFLLEQDFAYTSREELEERRKQYTARYVDKLFAIIEEFKDASKFITVSGERRGVTQYKGGDVYAWGKAVVYALNNKAELHAFLQCGNVECSNNCAERALRPAKFHSRSMEFLATQTGFQAFADLMTIVSTCKLNGVNPYQYVHWAFANAKIRVESYRLANCRTKQICFLPTPQKDKHGNTIGLYDPEFETPFDEIDWTGLDVWSYIKLRKEEAPRIKAEMSSEDSDN